MANSEEWRAYKAQLKNEEKYGTGSKNESFNDFVAGINTQFKEMGKAFEEILEVARLKAIEAATDATPPNANDTKIRGKNTIHGWLKDAWDQDSDAKVTKISEGQYKFTLRNNQFYASYVNDGHDLKKHYVPGLHIDEERGVLYFDENEPGGIMVGTKTSRIEGLHMTEKAHEAWKKAIDIEVKKVFGG